MQRPRLSSLTRGLCPPPHLRVHSSAHPPSRCASSFPQLLRPYDLHLSLLPLSSRMSQSDASSLSQLADADAAVASPSAPTSDAVASPQSFPTPPSQALSSPDVHANHQTSPSPSHSAALTPSLHDSHGGLPSPSHSSSTSPSFADVERLPSPPSPSSSSHSPPSTSLPVPSPAKPLPPGSQSALELARAGEGQLSAAIGHVYHILQSYQRLSDVNAEALTAAAANRAASDADDQRLALSIDTQRRALHEQLQALHDTLTTLHDRETPKVSATSHHPAQLRPATVERHSPPILIIDALLLLITVLCQPPSDAAHLQSLVKRRDLLLQVRAEAGTACSLTQRIGGDVSSSSLSSTVLSLRASACARRQRRCAVVPFSAALPA